MEVAEAHLPGERPLTIAGMIVSQVGLFVLITMLVIGLYSGTWDLAIGLAAKVCWGAWIASGILLVFAGGSTWPSGIAQTVGGTVGMVAAILFDRPQTAVYVMDIAAAVLCAGSYAANLAMLLPEKARVPCNVANVIFIMICITALVNVISFRSYHRLDWTSARFYELSNVTRKTLSDLDRKLSIVVFMRPYVYEGMDYVENPIHNYTKELLQRFRNLNPSRIDVEWLDPDWDRKRAEELLDKYRVNSYEVEETLGVIVLDYGEEAFKYVTSRQLVEFETIDDPMGGRRSMKRLKSFNGEAAIVASLKSLIGGEHITVCFLTGHGEKNPLELDEKKGGLPSLKKLLDREDFELRAIEDFSVSGVPEDCDVLVAAGPRRPLSENEVQLLQAAFARGVNLMLMLDPLSPTGGTSFAPSGLEGLLETWGVKLHNDIVTVWWDILGAQRRVNPVPASAFECDHTIINDLRDASLPVQFDSPRSMELVESDSDAEGFHPTALIRTSAKFWGETDFASFRNYTNVKDDRDYTGRLVVAAAVHETVRDGEQTKTVPRAALFGDSDFVDEKNIALGGNYDLFMNALYWLSRSTERIKMIGIAPKNPEDVAFEITRQKLNLVVLPIAIGLPAAVLLLGIGVWWTRRK